MVMDYSSRKGARRGAEMDRLTWRHHLQIEINSFGSLLLCWEEIMGNHNRAHKLITNKWSFMIFFFLSGFYLWSLSYYTVHMGMSFYIHFRFSLAVYSLQIQAPDWPALCMPLCIELQLRVKIGAHIWIECSGFIILSIVSSWRNFNSNIINNRGKWPEWYPVTGLETLVNIFVLQLFSVQPFVAV